MEILGNDRLMRALSRIASAGHVSHGYILDGAKGTGKKTIALAFRDMLGVSAADTLFVSHEKPGLISVDDVRCGINQSVQIRPYDSPYKIYIVDEAEKMNVQAQNALLKTIEEPPEYVIILLLSANADTFLDTILSRCVRLKVLPLPEVLVESVLAREGCSGEKMREAAKLSGGSIGKARMLYESEEFGTVLKLVLEMLKNARSLDPRGQTDFVNELIKVKLYTEEALEYIRLWFLDVLLYKNKAEEKMFTFSSCMSEIRSQALHMSYGGVRKVLDEVDAAKARLQANVNPELTLELLVMTIRDQVNQERSRRS